MSAGAGGGEPTIGSEFAGHRIEAVLGRGGMGVVYRALHIALDRPRALKVVIPELSASERFRERFRRESRLAASIEHPNVIPVHEAGESGGHLYLSMRLVEGADLRELVASSGPLDSGRALEIVGAVASALDAAHATGLIHRDVKPANILVGGGADTGRVFLTDFGISRTAERGETVTRAGELIGTADFIAPEQIAGDPVDHRADLYALGAVAHYALTGEPPFPRDSELATLFAHANAPRPRPSSTRPELPSAVDAVLGRALAVAPDDRFGSGRELAAALRDALEGAETVAIAPPDRAEAREPGRRRWALVAIGVAGIAAAVAAVALLGSDDEPRVRTTSVSTAPDVPQPRPSAPIEVGAGPVGLTVGDLKVWVAARDGNEVNGIDVTTSIADEPPIHISEPVSVAVGHGSIWAVSDEADALFRLDPGEGIEPLEIPLGPDAAPSDVATDSRWVWVSDEAAGTLARFDPEAPLEPAEVEELLPGVRAIATGLGSVWAVNADEATLSRVDAEDVQRQGSPIQLDAGRPTDVAIGEGSVWVTDNLNGTATEIDPERERRDGAPVEVGDLPRGVKAGLGYVWIALGGEDAVVRLDPVSHDLIGDPTAVGDNPADIALGGDAVWTANQDDATVTRIDP